MFGRAWAARMWALGVLVVSACSWQRFSEVADEPPVELLTRPAALRSGFGHVVAVAAHDEQVRALVGGVPLISTAAAFELGFDERPGVQALSSVHCEAAGNRTCFLATQAAGLAKVRLGDDDHERCFALGLGREDATLGVLMRCGNVNFARAVPDAVEGHIRNAQAGTAEPPELYAAADRGPEPALLVASPQVPASWFYAPLEHVPLELAPPRPPSSNFGRAVALARISGGYVLAVGDPGRAEVWIYRWLGEAAEVLGCLSGAPGFGRALAAGHVDGDEAEDLVVAEEGAVRVFDGASLAGATPAPEDPCGMDWLPEEVERVRLTCEDGSGASGCAEGSFGASLAVGDVDGDGRGEVIVGAPTMTSRGKADAGAVFIYALSATGGSVVSRDIRLLSSAESGSRFGSVLAVAPQRSRDVILAGAPGAQKAAIIYCSESFTGDSPRCR